MLTTLNGEGQLGGPSDPTGETAVLSESAAGRLTPDFDWKGIGQSEHFVQFYDSDELLMDAVSGFIESAIVAGHGGVIVTLEARRRGIEQRLTERGVDLAEAAARGRYLALDAAETLSKFMVDGSPDPARFADMFNSTIAGMAQDGRRLHAFGEMVALLWGQGNRSAALQLEKLWNDMGKAHSFSLFCAYPMAGFGDENDRKLFHEICACHTKVVPPQNYAALPSNDERFRAITDWQQKARILEVEIAHRKRAEQALRERGTELEIINMRLREEIDARQSNDLAQAKLVAIIESSDDAIVSKSLDGIITSWNKGAERLFGYTADEVIGKSILTIVPPERRGEEETILSKLRRGERIDHFETQRRSKDGHYVEVSLGVSPIRNSQGVIVGASKIARDIGERKRLEIEQKKLLQAERFAREESQRANRLKDDFLATLSHELRTPLTAIVGWAQLLAAGTMTPEQIEEASEVILRNARSQKQLIEDLLDMSRIVSGKLRLNLQRVEPQSFVEAAVQTIKPTADVKGITIEMAVDPMTGPIAGDPTRLQQVVWNVLTNAVKFTPGGGRVRVLLQSIDGQAELTIEDSGMGIKPEFLPYLFERFRQADASTSRRFGGLGIGLAIVQQLVEMHGGTITASSPGDGKGSTFAIRFPLLASGPVSDDRNRGPSPRMLFEADRTDLAD